ncbi:hypothetical protein [Lactobacillus sp. HT06-2]|uniref:hypothetical protein n=1 Tax=Lactobacillus sp. HT06-2 TaxID=2080222 RepID=UPI0013747D86|nr:hypothetical protein [Lactobacillus sp. HT06-2]
MIFDTRSRIKWGLIKALRQKPLYSIKDIDIIQSAKVAPAIFYKYYPNKIAILTDLSRN